MKIMLPFIVSLTIYYFFYYNNDIEINNIIENADTSTINVKTKSSVVERSISKKKTQFKKPVKRQKNILKTTSKLPVLNKHKSPQDENGNLYITSVVIDGENLIAHGDLIVGDIKNLKEYESGEVPLILNFPQIWTNSIIPYSLPSSLKNYQNVLDAINIMNKKTNVRWIPYQSGKHENFVLFKEGDNNCYSHVGMIGGPQKISLSPGCDTPAILHEMMHTLGFFHEQNKRDRDKYIEILWENIDEKYRSQFQIIEKQIIGMDDFEFNFNSIMMYANNAFSNVPGDYSIVDIYGDPTPAPPTTLSISDIERVGRIYLPIENEDYNESY